MGALSLRWRFLAGTWLVVLIVSGLFSFMLYTTQKLEYLQGVDARLNTGVRMARTLVGPEYHDRIAGPDSVSPEAYLSIVDRYNAICRETGFQYLWSNLFLEDGRIVFTSGTSASKDASQGDHALFFDVHSDPASFAPVRAAGGPTYSTFENEWGMGRMLLVPFKDAKGRTYVFGASVSIDELEHRLADTRRRAIVVFLCMMGLGAGVSLLLGHLTVRPLQRLRLTTRAIAAGDYGAEVAIAGGGEEMESLAESVNAMSHTIRENVNRLQELLQRQRLFAEMFRHSGEAIMITDEHNKIIEINPAFTKMSGYSPDEVRGRNPRMLASGKTPPETYHHLWVSLKRGGHWQGELWDRRKDGSIYPKWASISTIRDADGRITHHVSSFTDISERKAAEARIEYLAHNDVLTGLSNRYSLESRLEQALLTARREKRRIAVLFLDMDHFKLVNDTLGHATGDRMLREVADRLRSLVRESDIVARYGGDEFVVCLTNLENSAAVLPVTDSLLRSLTAPYSIDGHTLHSSPSIGVAVFPDDGDSVTDLLKNADAAMYAAKEGGRNRAHFFTATLMEAASARLSLERELRSALREHQFELHYQPKALPDGSVCGVEALVRWRHPARGLVPPLKFIRFAENTGLIEPIGDWVIGEAFRQMAEWKREGVRGLHMSVNISARQLRSEGLAEKVRAMLERYALDGADFEFEVTESVAMEDPEAAIKQLGILRTLGIGLAIDDFGTGYSSLAYLKRLPIQTLKLDRSFVKDIEHDPNDAAICAATVALAHQLGLRVVAEGVETEGQRAFLVDAHGCDILQGYLFGRPEPASAAGEMLKKRRRVSSDSGNQ